MRWLLTLLMVLAAMPLGARAQTAIYAGYSASDFHEPNVGWKEGPMFGVYYDHWGVPFVKVGVDARASFIGSGSTVDDSGFIGPRLQLHPHVLPLMPYAEGLIGAAHAEFGQGLAQRSGTNFAFQWNAGLDMTIFPRLDWRVAEYSWSSVKGLGVNFRPTTLTTGLVLRLP